MLLDYLLILTIVTGGAFISVKAKKLTLWASITGWIAGLLIFAGTGYTGVAMIATFFILGTGATSLGMSLKQNLGLAEKDKGRRTAGQVVANAGVAAILGILSVIWPSKSGLFKLLMAAAIASATADTLSSELGNIFGKNFYNIITLKKDLRGLDGVVSIEGTLMGIAGSTIIACVYGIGFGFDIHFLLIIAGGTGGNLSDSVLGATLERSGSLNNNEVNFCNTAIGALFALLLFHILIKE